METKTLKKTVLLAAAPDKVFETYATTAGHVAFTGQPANIEPQAGTPYSLFGGLIQGANLEMLPGEKIVQSWTIGNMNWPEGHESRLTLELFPDQTGTRLEMTHEGIPVHVAAAMADGWDQWYWNPLTAYLLQKDR